ncbi:hypothetical protein GLOIN_2v1507588 [Rhizophagus irregularis DAOM 181602=DAOM 197198]|uniref:Uncharacterized protein n=1 Tax=Rhizophagus irregularis (strain DAOM 181602 / DAOM 197198 / MUCL 43194) TaxID=747089 RepID=A0A2P4QUT5_RHIID|nr:hypothetical protein GLOIN_2v1507588 [Rhizophagus irregularis DAOM 181602=DAOM 197198]POG81406.1 hypothetical protein GLOIN_2v1507588 [Rhizophagus irregularis DAOM 181602=DAOM 197198]|eukprot:XP_025188272.1 hypothetical protein GLOIN_2v1507588 [Rhizophagus irregularis DAOM 181602=DAOM 197198]
MTLLFMLVKSNMLRKFMLIQIFCALGLNIFALLFLMNGLRKKMENLFSKNLTFLHNYLILSLGLFIVEILN